MRLQRSFGFALAVLVGGACEHGELIEAVSRDGTTGIPAIELTTAAAGGFLSGSRTTNRFLSSGVFDTTITDAFGRATTNPPYFRADPNPFYGTTSLIYLPNAAGATFTPPNRLLPALAAPGRLFSYYGSGPNAIAYIVPGGHAGNGAGNTVWEVWINVDQLTPATRYIMGLARYALQVNGATDWAELLLNGTVTSPDALVFRTGDFTPAGKKSDGVFTTNCASVNILQPTGGANPHLIAGGTTDAGGGVEFDQTICSNAASAWFNGLGNARSPVPTNNNTALGPNQYNFLVVWEALADSTPDYTKPVFRMQIGPVLTAAGAVANNSYAPIPTAALTTAQLALLPGATASPDSIKITANNLVPLAAGTSYQLWLAETAGGTFAKVTGNVVRLSGTAVVDTLSGVSDFNLNPGMTSARVEFDFLPFRGVAYNAAVLAVGATGAAAIPAGQPLWTPMVTQKVPGGAVPVLTSTLTFGTFGGGQSRAFGAAGSANGGIFGRELRQDIKRIPRPPTGYAYEAWLVSSTGATGPQHLGPLLSPYPELAPLTDADVSTAPPVSGVEITQAALRYEAPSAAFYCDWDRVQVRLGPKAGAGAVPPTVVLSGVNPRRGC